MKTSIGCLNAGLAGGRIGRLRGFSTLLIAVFLGLAAAGRAADVTGTYSDKGTVISTEDAQLSGEVSLHSLLTLNYEAKPEVYEKSDEVKFVQTETTLEAHIFDNEGKEISKARWAKDREYRDEEKKLTLTLRGSGENQNAVLVLEPSSDGKILEITLVKLTATAFGPVTQKLASIVFAKSE